MVKFNKTLRSKYPNNITITAKKKLKSSLKIDLSKYLPDNDDSRQYNPEETETSIKKQQ